MARPLPLVSLIALIVLAGSCTKPEGVVADPERKTPRTHPTATKGKEPKQHRATAAKCSKTTTTVTHEKRHIPQGKACTTNADCTEQKNGRCNASGHCAFDECYEDADCNGGKRVCVCREEGSLGYRCMNEGNCTVDADCAGQFCSPSFDNTCGAYHGVIGWFCHTKKDECIDDDDCKKDGDYAYCAYMPETGHWACGHAMCKG